ncbi:MAG: sensor histidine kinase, partial [Nitrospirales bacterium]
VDQAFPVVAGHRTYLRQVFDNLLSNAIKFMADQQAAEIRITSARKGAEVWFSVSDNGCGIPPEQREQVFEPFVRLQPQLAKGSGIGLPIVKRIVELYRGRVWIEPQSAPGCTVTFAIPAMGGFPFKDAGEDGSGRPVQEVGTQSPLA